MEAKLKIALPLIAVILIDRGYNKSPLAHSLAHRDAPPTFSCQETCPILWAWLAETREPYPHERSIPDSAAPGNKTFYGDLCLSLALFTVCSLKPLTIGHGYGILEALTSLISSETVMQQVRGSSSGVERLLAKEKVAGSNPVSRSIALPGDVAKW